MANVYKDKSCGPNDPQMIIYLIKNEINGKGYVGQCQKCFRFRYGAGNGKRSNSWWKYVTNNHLKAAINKYGYQNFSVTILEKNLPSIEILDEKEIFYIDKLQTLYPQGYNYVPGGQKYRGTTINQDLYDKWALEARGGRYAELLNNETGIIHKIINVNRFCKENNLHNSNIFRVLEGKQPYHGVWSLPNHPIKSIKLISQNGHEVTLLRGQMRKFCIKNNIPQSNLDKLINHVIRQTHGWRLNNV